MPAVSEAVTNERRRAVARHLIATLKATSSEPTRANLVRARSARRFMLFAMPLVRAILNGQKTVTRRVIKPAPKDAPKRRCPIGDVGDRIWVREKWGYRAQFYSRRAGNAPPFVYAAEGEPEGAKFLAWKSSLHMPRKACRIVLEITATRAERLRSITAKDAIAEGCPGDRFGDPVGWFAQIWDQHFAARGYGWSANPWVWVMGFQVATVQIR